MTAARVLTKTTHEAGATRITSVRSTDGSDEIVASSYWANYRSLVRIAVMLGCARSDAEDVVQDAFVRVYGRASELGHLDSIDGYLRTTVINLCRSRARRRAAWTRRLPRIIDEDAVVNTPEEAGLRAWYASRVARAMRELPRRQREAVTLRYYLDLDDSQLADAMSISKSAARAHVSRGIAALSALLAGDSNE
jgi:RNA polymerase sigma factor (sigma-70 family)